MYFLTCCISASGLSQICYGQRHGEKHSTLYNLRQAFEGCTFVRNNIIINASTLHDGSLSFLSRIVQVNGYVSIEAAKETYGVVVDFIGKADSLVRLPEHYRLDRQATEALRAGL